MFLFFLFNNKKIYGFELDVADWVILSKQLRAYLDSPPEI